MSEEIAIESQEKHYFTSDQKLERFGYGEWIEEPDEINFEYEGFSCKVLRNATQFEGHFSGGHLCGYVLIPENHKYYELHYEEINVKCHGGLTFSQSKIRGFTDKENEWWIGFDCAHCYDVVPSVLILEKELGTRLMGHFLFPDRSYKNVEFCMSQCMGIVDQLL